MTEIKSATPHELIGPTIDLYSGQIQPIKKLL